MKKIIKFKASDGEFIHIRWWRPKKVKGTIIVLHGMGDHSGWYNEFIDHFHLKGYEVYAMDRRGSGLNPSNKGDVIDYRVWERDIKEFIKSKKLKKVTLVGISLGSLLALSFALKHPNYVKDIILIVPALKNKLKMNLFLEVSILFAIVFNPTKMFQIPCPTKWVVADEKYIKKIRKDPLNDRYFTARFFREVIRMRHYVFKNYHKIHVPQIVFLGEDDHIIENNYTIKFFKDSKIIIYKGAQHGIVFGNIKGLANDIDEWLKRVKT